MSASYGEIFAQIEGWEPADGGAWEINPRRIGVVASQLRVTWPVTVAWMTIEDRQQMDREHDARVLGFRASSKTNAHTIKLRGDITPDEVPEVIRHELVHCQQVESLLSRFNQAYLDPECRELLEAEARELAATVATTIELARTANNTPGAPSPWPAKLTTVRVALPPHEPKAAKSKEPRNA